MGHKDTRESRQAIHLIANRYQKERLLGKGGMAVVYQVLDTVTGKRIALKQLRSSDDEAAAEEITKLFEYEYHTLAQLAHPRVIEVYNYGTDNEKPYYTMELLNGGDLRELSPLSWKEACSLMIDVCSALGLLHSRHQVHRDLTPLNIRCTQDHKAKLIDFGALAPMGPCKRVVGTPAFTAPEVVSLQTLDARTDLYSLGATFYYAITNRHPFPARNFADLMSLWRAQPQAPSTFIEDIPKEIDQLILSLISLDPLVRPVSAAEVMERLSAIAGVSIDDELVVSQAYLSTPTLVSRDEPIARIRKHINRAQRSRGGTVMITGAPGVGRSRLLNAAVLQGKVSGTAVLRADASDAYAGAWGVARALTSQLLETIPDEALAVARPYVPILGHVIPELLERFEETGLPLSPSVPPRQQYPISDDDQVSVDPSVEVWGRGNSWRPPPTGRNTLPPQDLENPQELRPRVQAALRDWLLEISEQKLLMVAVDDVNRIDEPSVAFLAVLAHEISKRKIVVAVTLDTEAPATSPAAIDLLRAASTSVEIENLDLESTEKLLSSLFGEVPNLGLLTDRLYSISLGNPRAVMQLTQHLIDRETITYKSGSWTIASEIDSADLPSSISETFRARVQMLSSDALALAQMMALSADQSFSYEECLFLPEHRDTARTIRALDELTITEVLSTDGKYYSFSQRAWVPELIESIEQEREEVLHERIAAIFEQRGDDAIRVARHLLCAGQEERALDLFIKDYEENNESRMRNPRISQELVLVLPPDWVDVLERLLAACERLDRPRGQAFLVRWVIVAYSAVTAVADKIHLITIIEQLYRDSGLYDYHELDESVQPPDRLWRALELAQQRYDSSPPNERVLPPAEAVRRLAQTTVMAISYTGVSFDNEFLDSLPSLAPLALLSAAFEVIDKNVKSTTDISGGRSEQARQGYLEVLERLTQPDHAGIDDALYEPTRLTIIYAIAVIEASLGRPTALERLEEFDTQPLFQVNAWRIRMIYYLRQGDTYKAEQCKRHLELLKVQHSPTQFFEGTHICAEVFVYSCSDDLLGMKQAIDRMPAMVSRFEPWIPALHHARAEYHRIRGDYRGAIAELDQTMQLVSAGRSAFWTYMAGCYLLSLLGLGQLKEAKQKGDEFLKTAVEANIDINITIIKRALALVEAKLGNHESAIRLAQSVIDQTKESEITGLNLGLAYETRARVAIATNDDTNFAVYAQLCAEQYKTGHNPALASKYEILMQEARRAMLSVTPGLANAAEFSLIPLQSRMYESTVLSIFDDHTDSRERARHILQLLVEHCNCSGGFLYLMKNEGPELSAKSTTLIPTAELNTRVHDRILEELADDDSVVTAVDESDEVSNGDSEWTGLGGETYRPVLLCHYRNQNFVVTGFALLLLDPNKPFKFADELVNTISKTLLDSGEVPAAGSDG